MVPKNLKGTPLGFFSIHFVAKYQKKPLETLKNFRKKVAQCWEKYRKGGPLVSPGFVGYVKKVKSFAPSFR